MTEMLLLPGLKVLVVERLRANLDFILSPNADYYTPTVELANLIRQVYTVLPETDSAIKDTIC